MELKADICLRLESQESEVSGEGRTGSKKGNRKGRGRKYEKENQSSSTGERKSGHG